MPGSKPISSLQLHLELDQRHLLDLLNAGTREGDHALACGVQLLLLRGCDNEKRLDAQSHVALQHTNNTKHKMEMK